VNRYSKEGDLLGSWGEAGMEPHQFFGCCNPTNLALFPDGRIVVSEKKLIRVKIYDAQGRLKGFIGSEQFSPAAEGMDLAVDSSGRIYVLDTGAELVRVFEREK
jgi:uncharacterized protein (DUF779 family)